MTAWGGALYAELTVGFPFGKSCAVGNLVTDFEEKLDILRRAGEVPVGFYFVGDLMVIVQIKFIRTQRCVRCAREKVFAVADVERGQTDFGKFEIVGAI